MKTAERAKLVETLKAAKEAGLKASQSEDGGTCNFDSPTIYLERIREATIDQIMEEAGLRCYRWRSMGSGSWVISGCTNGQGNARTRGAEAASKVLKAAGYVSNVYYQVD